MSSKGINQGKGVNRGMGEHCIGLGDLRLDADSRSLGIGYNECLEYV